MLQAGVRELLRSLAPYNRGCFEREFEVRSWPTEAAVSLADILQAAAARPAHPHALDMLKNELSKSERD